MNLEQLVERLRLDPSFVSHVSAWQVFPARSARYGPMPDLDPRLGEALKRRGITGLYTHQAEAVQAALAGPKRRSLAEVLMQMPNVGEDSDFARV